jgi:hypothetical protein
MNIPPEMEKLKFARISIPVNIECENYAMGDVFDFLGKCTGLTEEFIYNNTNPQVKQYPIYTASYEPIGYLPADMAKDGERMKVCDGEVIILFRQGYAGLMYIPSETPFFASEHTIPIRPKPEFRDKLNCRWFIKYYEPEVLHYVTGKADSRNFSELAFKKIPLLLPPKTWQDECAALYEIMDKKLQSLEKTLESVSIKM